MVLFPKIYTLLYNIKNKSPENDQALRKSPGHFSWVRTLKLTIFKEDHPKLYKIEIATELVK
jgi:hypothetical protein